MYARKYGCGEEGSRIKYLPTLFDSVARNTPPKYLQTFKGMSEFPGLYRAYSAAQAVQSQCRMCLARSPIISTSVF